MMSMHNVIDLGNCALIFASYAVRNSVPQDMLKT